jgi:hypothetical protein
MTAPNFSCLLSYLSMLSRRTTWLRVIDGQAASMPLAPPMRIWTAEYLVRSDASPSSVCAALETSAWDVRPTPSVKMLLGASGSASVCFRLRQVYKKQADTLGAGPDVGLALDGELDLDLARRREGLGGDGRGQ